MNLTEAAERFVSWLAACLEAAGRGDETAPQDVEPSGKFWLGRLASEAEIASRVGAGDRGERLEPCACGITFKPAAAPPWAMTVTVSMNAWLHARGQPWQKAGRITETIDVHALNQPTQAFGRDVFERRLSDITGQPGLSAEVRVEVETNSRGELEVTVLLVNTSPAEHPHFRDTRLYECSLIVAGARTAPFLLESLPDSFRYDRRVPAYGINCGVGTDRQGRLVTLDSIACDRLRPRFWSVRTPEPDITFATLGRNPRPTLEALVNAFRGWWDDKWSPRSLAERQRAEAWTAEMRGEADRAAVDVFAELGRLEAGLQLLQDDERLARAFMAMNRAMHHSAAGKFDRWRPFQIGYLLANLSCLVDQTTEPQIVDIVWFATGGGKTETYLGLLLTAAFYDRLRGKRAGITAWSRFPLRMLSLQQTQRFANALASAELVRRQEAIDGAPFSLGFFVGSGATPNSIKPDAEEGQPDPDDDEMPRRYKLLEACPFCKTDSLQMAFNRRLWTLEHRCTNDACPWPDDALPLYLVDDEIYRFLPTVVVGTLDKAASISMQAAMRGLVGPPLGKCRVDGHGYTYAQRSSRPNGCLVPGCPGGAAGPIDVAPELFAPQLRLQDELHLLRDSLGAVDSHYESLFDDLTRHSSGRIPKILASSATLSGYQKQAEVLYRRQARVFPQPGPSATEGFWMSASADLLRRYVAIAPRGVTIEYTVDRVLTELQTCIRRLVSEPDVVCAEAGVDRQFAEQLTSLYGTNVIYGNTLRDLDAVVRSIETQIQVPGPINAVSLTGKTDFEQVLDILRRLERPEPTFADRIHVVTASSMMSHGVDIDRLNVMIMLGLPLGTAEFIQATARVGRRYPALVLVVHKIGRERDASVFRSFRQFVEQGDRFLEPIPITRRSRRVLERTLAGLALSRILVLHEATAGSPLTTVKRLQEFVAKGGVDLTQEAAGVIEALRFDSPLDSALRTDIERWYETFGRNLADPSGSARFPSDLSPTGSPMLSLRDVEEQATIVGRRTYD